MANDVQDPDPNHLTGAIGTAFLLLVNVLMVEKGSLGPKTEYPYDVGPRIHDNLNMNFDFVIVGAGAAGCVLANRLSQRSEWNILLIEAGGDPSSTTEVPAFFPSLQNTGEDWRFKTARTKTACQGMLGQVCPISRGRVLGGTSTINNLLYMRGLPHNFEKWAELGNEAWCPDAVDFFYERVERYKGKGPYPVRLGRGNELPLDSFYSDHQVKEMIYTAASTLGYGKVREDNYLGYLEHVATVDSGTRYNMAKAFLTPIKSRRNLFMLKQAYVTKVLIPDSKEKRTKGVEFYLGNQLVNVKAKREVILCAGAINTPKIMLSSGLGPLDYLKSEKMPMIADLDVGKNLQIHFGVPVFVGLDKNNTDSADQLRELIDSTYLYMLRRTGPFTTTNINDLVGFINTAAEPFDSPNVMIYHYHFVADDINLKGFLENIGYQPEIIKSMLKHNRNQTLVMFLPTLLKPLSRGTVLLNTTNPLDRPRIEANFLTDKDGEDQATLVASFKYIIKLIESPPFKQHQAQLLHIDIPDCRNIKFCTDYYIKCQIKNLAFPQSDVAGTTRMGLPCDEEAVVDEDLLVIGVRGLRVVDASIMPEIVSGSIEGTAAMIADKISERIKTRWLPDYGPQPKCTCQSSYYL